MDSVEVLLHFVNVILASAAVFVALRLIPLTGSTKAWLFISAALVLLAVERFSVFFIPDGVREGSFVHITLAEVPPLAAFAFFLAGIISIRAVFREHKAIQETLEGQIISLQRSPAVQHAKVTAGELAAFRAEPDPGTKETAVLPMLQHLERERRWGVQMHREWQAAFDAVTEPIFVYDRDYRVIRANRAYANRAKMAFEDILGKPYFEIFPKLGHPIIDPLQDLQHGTARSELRLETGEIFLSRNFPVYDEANEYQFSLHVLEDVTRVNHAEKSVRRTRQALKVLSACTREMAQANDESEMLQTVCRVAVESGAYRLAWVGNAEHDENKTVRPVASHGYYKGYAQLPHVTWDDTGFGRGPMGIAIRTGKTCVANDMINDPKFEFWHRYAAQNNLASAVGLPLYRGGKVWGGLILGLNEAYAFSEEEVAVLEVLGACVAFGVVAFRIRAEHQTSLQEHKLRIEELRNVLENMILAIGMATEKRNPFAVGHQRRVAAIGMAIALEMGLPEERAYGVRLAGMVHNVGEIQVPEEILCKTGELTEDERTQFERHPEAGYEILKEINLPWPVAQTVLQHHERRDGSGYPRGLEGDKILLEAKILGVADTIEVVAYEQRPAHPRLGLPAALAELERNKGKLYDETVVNAALRLFREKGYEVP